MHWHTNKLYHLGKVVGEVFPVREAVEGHPLITSRVKEWRGVVYGQKVWEFPRHEVRETVKLMVEAIANLET